MRVSDEVLPKKKKSERRRLKLTKHQHPLHPHFPLHPLQITHQPLSHPPLPAPQITFQNFIPPLPPPLPLQPNPLPPLPPLLPPHPPLFPPIHNLLHPPHTPYHPKGESHSGDRSESEREGRSDGLKGEKEGFDFGGGEGREEFGEGDGLDHLLERDCGEQGGEGVS